MAVYDPQLQAVVLKYPTQLLQALLEGLVLFIILAIYARKPRPAGSIAGLFLVGYGSFRFLAEFFRMPDAQLGYLAWDWLTMGQVLSVPMVLIGAGLMVWVTRRPSTHAKTQKVG
jgi:phosphatidylglycerol:prolipoprotein diacylglycerol transferase